MSRPFARIGANPETWAEQIGGVVDVGTGVAQDALQKESDSREGIDFNVIYNNLFGNWKSQTDSLVKTIFNGEDENIKALADLFSSGKLIQGLSTIKAPYDNHTDHWRLEENIERGFYALAIPAAWSANRPAPVVVDFGLGCEIDARGYFLAGPDSYNVGWKCVNQHSYILAGVRDDQARCGVGDPNAGGCPSTPKYTFDILHGMDDIDDRDPNNLLNWSGVTVSDIVIGYVSTEFTIPFLPVPFPTHRS